MYNTQAFLACFAELAGVALLSAVFEDVRHLAMDVLVQIVLSPDPRGAHRGLAMWARWMLNFNVPVGRIDSFRPRAIKEMARFDITDELFDGNAWECSQSSRDHTLERADFVW